MTITKYECLSNGIVQKMGKPMHCQQSGYVLRGLSKSILFCVEDIAYYKFFTLTSRKSTFEVTCINFILILFSPDLPTASFLLDSCIYS